MSFHTLVSLIYPTTTGESIYAIVCALLWALCMYMLVSTSEGAHKLRQLMRLLCFGPVFAVCMYVDTKFRHLFRLPFPRNLDEILSRPADFCRLIHTHDNERVCMDAGVRVVAMHTEEPKKNETSAMVGVECESDDGGGRYALDLFVKFTGERAWPLFVRAVSAAFQTKHVEVEFHRTLAELLPIPTPVFRGAIFSRPFQRSLIITELLPRDMYRTQPDHERCDFLQTEAMLTDVARMHGMYWHDKALECEELRFLRENRGFRGLECYDRGLQLFMSRSEDPWFPKLWTHLRDYFADERVCLSHGDYRPGNMLFLSRSCSCATDQCSEVDAHDGVWKDVDVNTQPYRVTSAHEPHHQHAPHVVYADWEALAIVSFMWDFTYFTILSQSPDIRRRRHSTLLSIYRNALLENGVPEDDIPEDKCNVQYQLITIVLVYYSWMLVQFDAVGDVQGNSNDDMKHWNEVIHEATEDIDIDRVTAALNCDRGLVESFVTSMRSTHATAL